MQLNIKKKKSGYKTEYLQIFQYHVILYVYVVRNKKGSISGDDVKENFNDPFHNFLN